MLSSFNKALLKIQIHFFESTTDKSSIMMKVIYNNHPYENQVKRETFLYLHEVVNSKYSTVV
jgi:hypothetical protein